MKKRMIAALAGLMVLALGSVTVLASPSGTTAEEEAAVTAAAAAVTDTAKESSGDAKSDELFADLSVASAITPDGTGTVTTNGATIIVSEVRVDEELAALSGMTANEIIAEAEKQAKAEAIKNVATFLERLQARQDERKTVDVKQVASFSLTAEGLSPEQEAALKDPNVENYYVKLTFNVTGVERGKSYVVMHYCSKHKTWESMDPTVGDGTITLTFHSFSPVTIVEVVATDAENLGEGEGEGNSTTLTAGVTSPKTGETVPFAAVLSVALFAGAAVCAAKRVKFN
jgi:hypothetical protein